MRRVSSAEELFDAPEGAYLGLRSVVYGCWDRGLWFVTTSGSPEEADVRAFIQALEIEVRRDLPAYASLVDFRRMTSVSLAAFTAWVSFAERHREAQRRMLGEVVLRPATGIVASILAGYGAVVRPLHPFWVETEPAAALARLGRPDATGVLAAIDAIHEAEHGGVVERLRAALAAGDVETVEAAARTLNLSSRSLQRGLQGAGTTFQRELVLARVRQAERLLEETDEKLASVAAAVGFSSQAHLTRAFVEVNRVTPSAYRARARDPASRPK